MNTTLNKFAIGVLLLAACEEDDNGDDGAMQAEDTGDVDDTGEAEESSSGGEMNFDELYECQDAEPVAFGPLAGPGWDPETGPLEPVQENYVASSTMIMVKPEQMGLFFELAAGVQTQLEATDGFVAATFANDPNCGWVRTLSLWRDEASMYGFVATGAHAMAMSRTWEVAITGKTVAWPIGASELPPTWAMARAQLDAVEPLESY
jgi:heme-degrading monooxygenase HmoA